jgi:hypothetical protein
MVDFGLESGAGAEFETGSGTGVETVTQNGAGAGLECWDAAADGDEMP